MEAFVADGHYLEGLASCALTTWMEAVALARKARRAALVCLANASARAFMTWRQVTGDARSFRQKHAKVSK